MDANRSLLQIFLFFLAFGAILWLCAECNRNDSLHHELTESQAQCENLQGQIDRLDSALINKHKKKIQPLHFNK